LHTDKEPKDIIREKNEKFFQYYRTTDGNNNLSGFGAKVQIYDDTYKGDLILIDKKNNFIKFGYEEKLEDFPYHFKTRITLQKNVIVYNATGLQIYNSINNSRTNLMCDRENISFMDYCETPSSLDIVFPKELRFKPDESLKIQKPYTLYQSGENNEITIPYGTNLTNLESRLATLESNEEVLTIENNGIEFVDSSDLENKIIIPYGTTIPENFIFNFDTYLPTIPKYLFTYSGTGTPISKLPLSLTSLMMEKTHMQEFMFLLKITVISYLLLIKMIIPHS
jgi:hypothetical protein